MGKRDVEKTAKAERERSRQRIDTIYPGAQTLWSEGGEEKDWQVGGEPFLPLGKSNKLFVSVASPTASGLYDFLSDFSHPSLVSLHRQTERVEADGVATMTLRTSDEIVAWQTRLGCAIFFKATQLLAAYHGLDEQPLDEWAQTVPADWFA
jgi:hypothetical protein